MFPTTFSYFNCIFIFTVIIAKISIVTIMSYARHTNFISHMSGSLCESVSRSLCKQHKCILTFPAMAAVHSVQLLWAFDFSHHKFKLSALCENRIERLELVFSRTIEHPPKKYALFVDLKTIKKNWEWICFS